MFMNIFDNLPLACVINGRYLCMHGGISPSIQKISQVNQINRFMEVPQIGGLCDLLWSDPVNNLTGEQSQSWVCNGPRGCSYIFGKNEINQFLK